MIKEERRRNKDVLLLHSIAWHDGGVYLCFGLLFLGARAALLCLFEGLYLFYIVDIRFISEDLRYHIMDGEEVDFFCSSWLSQH
jgi:hypothetical protein